MFYYNVRNLMNNNNMKLQRNILFLSITSESLRKTPTVSFRHRK